MRAALDDAPVVHHQDLVGVHHRRQAVRDHQRRVAMRDAVKFGLDRFLRPESSAEVASSKIMILGFLRIARAIATRCFSPPESFRPRSPTRAS